MKLPITLKSSGVNGVLFKISSIPFVTMKHILVSLAGDVDSLLSNALHSNNTPSLLVPSLKYLITGYPSVFIPSRRV